MKNFLINLNTMTLVKAVLCDNGESVQLLEYWADILMPRSEFYICGDTKRELARWSQEELLALIENTSGYAAKSTKYSKVIETVSDMFQHFETDETELPELIKKLGHELKPASLKPQKEKEGTSKAKASSGGDKPVTRPKDGTASAQVWDAADYYYKEESNGDLNSKDLRDTIISNCVNYGINKATASTQFARWKKHHQQA